jgi:hypothetical protein
MVLASSQLAVVFPVSQPKESNMTIAVEAAPDAVWPPEKCPEWCMGNHREHPEYPEHLEDRHHADFGIGIELSVPWPQHNHDGVIVGLRQYPEGPVLVELDATQITLLTPSEARGLAAALIAEAGLAEAAK